MLQPCLGICVTSQRRQKFPSPTHVAVRNIQPVVYLEVGNIETSPESAITTLSQALKDDRKHKQFRVHWTTQVLSLSTEATALYDRQNKQIRFYADGGYGGSFDIHDHFLYTGVTEAFIHRLAKQKQDTESGSYAGFFDELPQYGCKRAILK